MKQLIIPFDPSASTQGTIQLALNGGGTLILRNFSPIELSLTFNTGEQDLLEAWTGRRYDFNRSTTSVLWQQYIVPTGQQNSPLSQVTGVQYDPKAAQCIKETYPVAFHRLANIGNPTVNTTGVSSVTNDGNPTGTRFIEATEDGSTSSNVSIYNDGSALFNVFSKGAYASVLQIERGTASAAAQLILQFLSVLGAMSADGGHITSDGNGNLTAVSFIGALTGNASTATSATEANSANAVNADSNAGTQVTEHLSGAAPTFYSVHITPSKGAGNTTGAAVRLWNNGVSSDVIYANYDGNGNPGVPPSSLNDGAIPAGVTLPAGQVTGTLPASQVGSGYPAANLSGTLPAGQVGSGYPAANLSGTVPTASAANALNLDSNASTQFLGHTAATNYATLVTPQPSGVAQHMSFRTYDGTTAHDTDTILPAGGINTANLASGALPAGVTIGGSQVNLDGSPAKHLLGIQFLTGSASGTYSHGLGNTPSGVFCNTDNGSNSTTFGSGSYTSSSVYIYVYSSQAFVAQVMRGG